MKRLLVYSHDTYGLGNIRRMLEITRHLVERDPEMSALLISGSPMLHAFRIPDRVDYVKLPCLSRDKMGTYGSKYLDLSLDETLNLRANLICAAVMDFRPDLILVDKKPFGVGEELSVALDALPRTVGRPRLVLLLRDILDSPETTASIWARNNYFEAIGGLYDEVLVVGSRAVFDLPREYKFPPRAAAKVRFCGYLARRAGTSTGRELRTRLGIAPREPFVVVTPGGGEDGFSLVDAYLKGLAALGRDQAPRSLVICGPEMSPERTREVHAAASDLEGVMVQTFSDDMMTVLDAADVVVSMAGYNTVCELLTLKKRAVVVPRVRPVEEQWIRAQRMQSIGLLRAIHPDALTPEALIGAVLTELQQATPVPTEGDAVSMHGLCEVDAAIQMQFASRRRQLDEWGRRIATENGRKKWNGQLRATALSASC